MRTRATRLITVYFVNGAGGHYDGLDAAYVPLNDYVA